MRTATTHLPPPALPCVSVAPLRFVRRGRIETVANVPPDGTLLTLLRERLALGGVKEGCNEGDCGACTVVLAEAAPGGGLRYRSVNACIQLAHAAHGRALWTAQDLTHDPLLRAQTDAPAPALHPAQQAMVDAHASQCGFCTPGFVMSLFALYHDRSAPGPVTPDQARQALSGNLCRCTGYRPILDAACAMHQLPAVQVDEAAVRRLLRRIETEAPEGAGASDAPYLAPRTLPELLRARVTHPQAQLVAGCTDVGLWITKAHRRFARVLDLTRCQDLQRIERYPHHIAIGAAVTLERAFAALQRERPQLADLTERFAGLPVRNAGTLGGNIANGSPIGDAMPLLLALGASLVLMRWDARRHQVAHREVLLQDYYTGYRQSVLRADEVLAWIKVPRPQRALAPGHARRPAASGEWLRAWKVSKRWDDDISAVCLALWLRLERGVVREARLGLGGVAATPVRAPATEAALCGQPWSAATVAQAAQTLAQEFAPLSDMRASADYRRAALSGLLHRAWREALGEDPTRLRDLGPLELPA